MSVADFKRSLKDSGDKKLVVMAIAMASERAMYEKLINGYEEHMCPFAPRVVLEYLDELQQLLNDEIERREATKRHHASQRFTPALASAR